MGEDSAGSTEKKEVMARWRGRLRCWSTDSGLPEKEEESSGQGEVSLCMGCQGVLSWIEGRAAMNARAVGDARASLEKKAGLGMGVHQWEMCKAMGRVMGCRPRGEGGVVVEPWVMA